MADDLIRYDVLVSDALRGVVRQVLTEIAATGLPGEHHFYITIDTRLPGVRISSALRQRFPEEMTVVLQHQFWDLKITEQTFEVGLSFSGVPERLLIPFSSITGFADPSVDFALKFETLLVDDADMVGERAAENEHESDAEEPVSQTASDGPARLEPPKNSSSSSQDSGESKDDDEGDESKSADVVSLDAFRKKS
ncbi:MAG: ClpXP protease specificity-enhancing factor SspB [Pseudomonadota bacterium]